MIKKLCKYLLCLAFLLLLLPSGALAHGQSLEKNLFQRGDIRIPEGQWVENVVTVGGDATVYGSVSDAVVVINGDLNLKKSAQVMGMVLVVGGKIVQEPGAQLTESVLNINFDQAVLNGLILGAVLMAAAWFLRLAFSLLMIILPVFTVVIARHRMEPYKALVRRSPWRLMIIGAAASLFVTAIGVLLSVTIIGISIALVLLAGTLLFFVLGLAAISLAAGEQLPVGAGKPPWITAAGGSVAIAAGINLPFFGSLLLLGLFWVALGVVIMRLWEIRTHKIRV